MDLTTKLRNLFLVMDNNKEGVLNEASVVLAFQSIGFVLPNDVKANVTPMNCTQFVNFGTQLAKKLPSDGGVGDLYSSLAGGKSKKVDMTDVRQVMETLKLTNASDLDTLSSVLDPRNTGYLEYDALNEAFKA
ncbi:uncharacterized protein TA21345 [Theileria annulata]|uniref:EF-hand domain-containing protein n=1 Tax=Theileria annulata TaxID=5874 RepID=Q4UGN8_THEAN|nr:uncharacterized protein TA21345 [Theileria annulata]CAI73751.1 hypothetical protein TA21345 [Theileria annulata]|eukprot:XP_954428.1 hypothetical protein TA21345 [Theileria annulata]